MTSWNNIYEHFSLIAFSIGGISVHWYGIAYVIAIILSVVLAFHFNKTMCYGLPEGNLDKYFLVAELGIIIGARIFYILVYDPNTSYYLEHPLDIFNPFYNGKFVGISGMSYHGGAIGFLLASYIFARICRKNPFLYLDLVALSLPLAYVFGRIGNFLNKELYGRPVSGRLGEIIGIKVDGVLVYPSQLIEAFIEGIVVFVIIYAIARYQLHLRQVFRQNYESGSKLIKDATLYPPRLCRSGVLVAAYAIAYSLARYVCEYFRAPDAQLGFIIYHYSMGQLLSLGMGVCGVALLAYILLRRSKKVDFDTIRALDERDKEEKEEAKGDKAKKGKKEKKTKNIKTR